MYFLSFELIILKEKKSVFHNIILHFVFVIMGAIKEVQEAIAFGS